MSNSYYNKMYTKTEFFEEFGRKGFIVKVLEDSPEAGDYQLFCPEEMHIAKEWQDKGCVVASVFDGLDGEDWVRLDNDLGESHHKIGYIILDGISFNSNI